MDDDPAITTPTHVFFYSGRTIYSNWHRTKNQFKDPLNNDLAFDSTEQAFFWWKAVFFQDHKIATLLERDTDPGSCKRLGRLVANYDDNSWECVRLGFMTYVNLLKYSQNPAWKAELLGTGSRILVEASPVDRIWGVGLDVTEAVAYYDSAEYKASGWPGRNLLGIALMSVREMLKKA